MKVAVIVNPSAGRGLAARRLDAILGAFRRHGVEPDMLRTAGPGDARILAKQAGSSADTVVAIGGDGTVHETACGLYTSGGDAALGVIPAGSGNDFAKVLRMPSDPVAAVDAVLSGPVRRVDLGLVTATDVDGETHTDVFVNAVGVGFDSMVAERAVRARRMRGTFGYLVLAIQTLAHWKPVVMSISSGDWKWDGSTLLVTLGNGTCSGGGFYLTPSASIADGKLDLCHIAGMAVPRMLLLLPRTLWGGHVGARSVTYFKTAAASIGTDRAIPVHLDGELLSTRAHHLSVRVLPAALAVRLSPDPAA